MSEQQAEVKPVGEPHWRQLDIVSRDQLKVPFVIIGGGAIGSLTALFLAKMGAGNITVYDFDTVEDHNWPNQFYGPADEGRTKVEALAELVARQTGVRIKPVAERYETQPLAGIVIAAVDSMAVRAQIWKQVRLKPSVKLLIDARMGGLVGAVYAVRPTMTDDIKLYEDPRVSYRDDQTSPDPCTARAIIYNVGVIAGLVANTVKKVVRGEPFPREQQLDLVNLMIIPSKQRK